MKLTFFGGVSEIGGNKILLRDQDTTMFIDFGRSFQRRGTTTSPPSLEAQKARAPARPRDITGHKGHIQA